LTAENNTAVSFKVGRASYRGKNFGLKDVGLKRKESVRASEAKKMV
jgi:hypothetical protein